MPEPLPLAGGALLSVPQIAALTGLGERFARRMVDERRVPVVKVGKYVRVRRADLDAYLDEHTQPARSAR